MVMIDRYISKLIDDIDKMGFFLDDNYTTEGECYTFIKRNLTSDNYTVTIDLSFNKNKWHLYGIITDDYEVFDAYPFSTEELGVFFQLLCVLEEKYKEVKEDFIFE